MFFARAIKPGQTIEISPEDGGEILHISQVCMSKAVDNQRTFLKVKQEGESFAACVLQKDKTESCSIDLFLATTQKLSLTNEGGKNEIHIIGYFEPEGSDDEDMCHHDDDEDDEEGNLYNNSMIPNSSDEDDDDDDDDDDEDEDEDEEEEEDDDDDDDDGEDLMKSGKFEDLDAPKTNGKAAAGKKQNAVKLAIADESVEDEASSQDESAASKKRKTQAGGNAAKKTKGEAKSSSNDETTYCNALVDFLKKNGKTPLATLGQKVKKPQGVDAKMAVFLKSKPEVFNIENGFCSLC